MTTSPFAYGASGTWLTCTQDHEVFICDAGDEHTMHVVALDARVVGLRNTAAEVLALDGHGTLQALDPRLGTCSWTLALGHGAIWLDATSAGRWAVVLGEGVLWGEGAQVIGQHPIPRARFARLDTTGRQLAVATEDGQLFAGPIDGQLAAIAALGGPPTGLAHSALGWWSASTTHGIVRVPAGGGAPEFCVRWMGNDGPQGVACSQDGRVCAFRVAGRTVELAGVERGINLGSIRYLDRAVGELDFGPGPWLGVGLGLGDGNKIYLLNGACHRTDPPPGRHRNRWMLEMHLDSDNICEVLGAPGGSKWGPDSAAVSRSRRLRRPLVGLAMLAVGLALAFTVSAGWYDDYGWILSLAVLALGIVGYRLIVGGRNSS